jgi:rhodanese-related sulfurtransferase
MASSSSSPPSIAVKPVADAEQLRASGTPYLDVRTPGEFAAGHPPGAINVDWLGSVGPEDFVAKVKQVLPDAKSIVVGCKSGRRSASACSALAASGYAAGGSLVDVEGGFDAWSAAGLPVEK